MKPSKKSKPPSIFTGVRLTRQSRAALEQFARRGGRSLGQVLREALAAHTDNPVFLDVRHPGRPLNSNGD